MKAARSRWYRGVIGWGIPIWLGSMLRYPTQLLSA